MKRIFNLLFHMILTISSVIFIFSGSAEAETRMSIVAFENASRVKDSSFGGGLADILLSELMQNKNYYMVERLELDRTLNEQGLCMSGVCEDSSASQVGKILNLNYIVTGKIIDASYVTSQRQGQTVNIGSGESSKTVTTTATIKVLVNIKVVDVETGRVVFSDNSEGQATSSVTINTDDGNVNSSTETWSFYAVAAREAIGQVALKIMTRIDPIEPYVMRVRGKEIVISMGRNDEIREGQKYMVVREGEPLRDRNGEIVDVETIKVAEVIIKRLETNSSYCEIKTRYKEEFIKPNGKSGKRNIELLEGDILRPINNLKSPLFGFKLGS